MTEEAEEVAREEVDDSDEDVDMSALTEFHFWCVADTTIRVGERRSIGTEVVGNGVGVPKHTKGTLANNNCHFCSYLTSEFLIQNRTQSDAALTWDVSRFSESSSCSCSSEDYIRASCLEGNIEGRRFLDLNRTSKPTDQNQHVKVQSCETFREDNCSCRDGAAHHMFTRFSKKSQVSRYSRFKGFVPKKVAAAAFTHMWPVKTFRTRAEPGNQSLSRSILHVGFRTSRL